MSYASYYKPELHDTSAEISSNEISNSIVKSLLTRFQNWRLKNQTRQQLRRLPDYVLQDIGINRYQIEHDLIRF